MDIFFGPRPGVGDKIYVDFGDSIIDGGEVIGWVRSIKEDDLIELEDASGNFIEAFNAAVALHIKVVN